MFNRLFKKPTIAEKTGSAWPFDQPENCAAITSTHVLQEGQDITRVSHDLDDHGWQFLHGGEMQTSDAMVVLLKNIVAHDPTVLQVADMPPGWVAVRTHRGAPWQKHKNEG
jgi:hypothetical protein